MIEFCLPQHDSNPRRRSDLLQQRSKTKIMYAFDMPFGDPSNQPAPLDPLWQVAALRSLLAVRANLDAVEAQSGLMFTGKLAQKTAGDFVTMVKAQHLDDLVRYLAPDLGILGDGGRPRHTDEYKKMFIKTPLPSLASHWDNDESFAYSFLAGPNPGEIRRLKAAEARFPITNSHLHTVAELAGDDLGQAIAEGRVYIIDHSGMASLTAGAHPQAPKHVVAPLGAFAVPRGGGRLYAFAIQCGPDAEGREIYTPADGYGWKIARNCLLAAHNTHQAAVSHLAATHLVMEAVALGTQRHLAANHPVHALLSRHTEGTPFINHTALTLLTSSGGDLDRLVGADLRSLSSYLATQRREFSFRENYLPSRFASHQTDDDHLLPVYPYRDDGMLLWTAIAAWASDFVDHYYRADIDVVGDDELQGWANEIAAPDLGKIKDFGATPGTINNRRDLAEVLTMIMFTAGPQHAALHFSAATDMAYLPANPLAVYTSEPKGKSQTEQEWLDSFPPLDVALETAKLMGFLGGVRHGCLGDYGDKFTGAGPSGALRRFQLRLVQIEQTIDERNSGRAPYVHLKPSRIPGSINI